MQETQQRVALETSLHRPKYLIDPEVCHGISRPLLLLDQACSQPDACPANAALQTPTAAADICVLYPDRILLCKQTPHADIRLSVTRVCLAYCGTSFVLCWCVIPGRLAAANLPSHGWHRIHAEAGSALPVQIWFLLVYIPWLIAFFDEPCW